MYDGKRVLYDWTNRQHLNEVWSMEAWAIAIIEQGVEGAA